MILAWHRKLIAKKFDGSKNRKKTGRPTVDPEVEALIIRMAQENKSWGYDRIEGALSNLGYSVSDQTIGNILKRNGITPAPKRKKTTTWKEFIAVHKELLVATDFFTAEVWTLFGLATYYVLFFIRINTREIHIAGYSTNPDEQWMTQIGRNITMSDYGFLENGRYLIHDRDRKFCAPFNETIESAEIKRVPLPPRSPNLNAIAERWVRSIKEECLSKLILFGERSLRKAVKEYELHYHQERNHQGRENVLLFPSQQAGKRQLHSLNRRKRLGGILSCYHLEAA